MKKYGINKESCKKFVEVRKEGLAYKVQSLKNTPSLHIIQVGDNPASNKYVGGKIKDCKDVGVKTVLHKYSEETTTDELCYLIRTLMRHNGWTYSADGVIVQLPLPKHINEKEITNEILKDRDVDGFKVDSMFTPCTPKGIIDYLNFVDYDFEGKIAVVIGRSEIVGKPMVDLLRDRNCTVINCHSKTRVEDMKNLCKQADLIVSAAGVPNLITKEFVNSEKMQVLIDVSINFNEEGKMCGDAHPEIYDCDSIECTPVPGGVGLLTRMALVENTVISASVREEMYYGADEANVMEAY